MREWNVPELKVLTIGKTENGIFNTEQEFWWITNDSKKSSTQPDKIDTIPTDALS